MSRITQIAPQAAAGRARTLLDAVKGKFGLVPNMTRAMANSPVALDGYLQLSGALDKGELSPKVREQIALAVAEANGCDYCLAAHSAVGKMAGLTAEQIQDSRRGTAGDPKTVALLRFARRVVDARGLVSDRDLDTVREAGFGDGAIAEMVANVVLHVFTNYFNRLARTDLDFPQAPALEPGSAMASGLQASANANAKGPIMDVPTIVVRPGEGRSVWLGGMGVLFKVSGADTAGAFAVVEHPIEPGRLVLPHLHQHEDEYSYVLEGTIGGGR